MIMFSLVFNHLKQRIVVVLQYQIEPFISSEGVGPLPQSCVVPPCVNKHFCKINHIELCFFNLTDHSYKTQQSDL